MWRGLTLGDWEPLFHPDGVALLPESPREQRTGPALAPTPSASPMAWSDALERCELLSVGTKMLAYEMSYGYLDGGPAWFSGLERELREEVARLDTGAALPDELGKTLFAWKNATYMARRRSPSELPESWKTPAPSSDDPMYDGTPHAQAPAQAILPDAYAMRGRARE